LNFNRPFETGWETGMMRTMPLFSRFLSSAALASVIGGLLLTYGWGHAARHSVPVTPASAEMMQMLRDEHGLVASMQSAQLTTEKQVVAAGGAERTTGAPRQAIAR
jgi:hypothetical protein